VYRLELIVGDVSAVWYIGWILLWVICGGFVYWLELVVGDV